MSFDVIQNLPKIEIKCLDKGVIKIIDMMPRIVPQDQKTADYAVVQAARVSYGDGTKSPSDDRSLIRYLMRHSHTTPFEMIEFKFHMKLPIFVARQVIRTRTASVNEYSGRYSIMKDEFYVPDVNNVRKQSNTNKQGGDDLVNLSSAEQFIDYLNDLTESSYSAYQENIEKGISREQARMSLPINLYTEWYWKIDLHNLLHFLALRCDSHAQYETTVFANALLELITPAVPTIIEAWNDYHPMRNAVKLTSLEVESIKKSASLSVGLLDSENEREQNEWISKCDKLGFKVLDKNGHLIDNFKKVKK